MMANFDTAYFHHVCINVLYAMAALLTFVLVERLVYYVLLNVRASRLVSIINGTNPKAAEKLITRRDLMSSSLAKYIGAVRDPGISRHGLEDLSAALFIKVSGRIGARLWLLDTVVTAAPLLGLLGTILGIMDTFNALSAGGISDPAAVSRGIASALIATAIGIGVALFGLLGHNLLHRYADHLTEDFKRLILSAESYVQQSSASAQATLDAAHPAFGAGAASMRAA